MGKYLVIVRSKSGDGVNVFELAESAPGNLIDYAQLLMEDTSPIDVLQYGPPDHCEVWFRESHHKMDLLITVY